MGWLGARGFLVLTLTGCGGSEGEIRFASSLGVDLAAMDSTASGLRYQDRIVGDGPEVTNGMTVVVHYTGWLPDGTKFDSSKDRGQPFRLTIPGGVIQGWNEGIPGMRVGGRRLLVVPSELAYGSAGAGDQIPPFATLVFEIDLLEASSQ